MGSLFYFGGVWLFNCNINTTFHKQRCKSKGFCLCPQICICTRDPYLNVRYTNTGYGKPQNQISLFIKKKKSTKQMGYWTLIGFAASLLSLPWMELWTVIPSDESCCSPLRPVESQRMECAPSDNWLLKAQSFLFCLVFWSAFTCRWFSLPLDLSCMLRFSVNEWQFLISDPLSY